MPLQEKGGTVKARAWGWVDPRSRLAVYEFTVSRDPQSPLAKAMGYAANHWQALTRLLDDGRLPLDNNAAERALCPIALGPKNWLFAGSVRGGEAAAMVLPFIESANLHALNPYACLRDVRTRLPAASAAELDSLLPHLLQPR